MALVAGSRQLAAGCWQLAANSRPQQPALLSPSMHVAVIGSGSWGTTVAALVASHADVKLWARRVELAESMNSTRRNDDYLPSIELPDRLEATADIADALTDAQVIVMAVPSHGYRAILQQGAAHIARDTPVVSLSKGIERDTLKRMTEVTADTLVGHSQDLIGVLTGPNLAAEVAAGQPAASVIAMPNEVEAARLQHLFMGQSFRVYTNPDVIGCEAAGALKNVMAIAAGIASGLGYGDNSMATLITRALAELTRLGVALGGKPLTFAGLAGMGDLIATCVSTKSRNHRVGHGLGTGKTLDEVTGEMNMVAEGVKSTAAVLELAQKHGIEMPIAEQVGAVLYDGADVKDVLVKLLSRRAKSEMHGID